MEMGISLNKMVEVLTWKVSETIVCILDFIYGRGRAIGKSAYTSLHWGNGNALNML